MNDIKSKNVYTSPSNSNYTVRQAIVNYYIFLMFTAFPLFFTNGYFNIRHDKYYLFLGLSFVFIIAQCAIFAFTINDNPNGSENASAKPWYTTLSVTDFAVIALLISCTVSTIFSPYPETALFGTQGRNNGLLLIIVYAAVYFIITRNFNYKKYIFISFAAVSAIVFLLAILNCFSVDPLGMYVGISDEKTLGNFTSTIGNINLMSSYICIALPVMITMSVLTNNNRIRTLYLAVCGLGFAALMTSDSDSGILGIGVFLIVYFIWFSRKIKRLKRYFLSITVILAFAKLLRLFSLAFNDNSKEIDVLQRFFIYSNKSYILLVLFAVITALLYLLDNKRPDIVLPKTVPIILSVFTALIIISTLIMFIYFSFFDVTTSLGSFERLLRFNDKWGTHRGYMWIRSMCIFKDASIYEKLFGVGPDNFYYAFSPYFSGLQKYGDSSTNAAHNEYINYLITIGITGLTAYLTVIGATVVRAIKVAKNNPLAMVCISAVICYFVQAIVNIAQPITTPLFIIFIALSEAASRGVKTRNK